MPVPFMAHVYQNGLPAWFPDPWLLLKVSSAVSAVGLTKWYTSGRFCLSERNMHGRVVMLTGGTSGIGAAAAFELAKRGAQLILLTHQPASDPFLVEFIDDMRERTGNNMIYAEQVDLSSLHSIRLFATKWINNSPPRRLDMVILCAATLTPPGKPRTTTNEGNGGVETTWMVNYLANFHLLSILNPAIKAQPFDRDVRIIMTTCSSYISAPPLEAVQGPDDSKGWSPSKAYARSKLALMTFGLAYQKHLDAYKRPDELPMNSKVIFVDPGYARTPGMTRWLTRGSIWGLFVYMFMYILSWLFLKSSAMGAQSILFAALDGSLGPGRGKGGELIKECIKVDYARKDVHDDKIAQRLWESSDKLIERIEKEEAVKRARAKKEQEEREKEKKEKEKEKLEEIESLVNSIKEGKKKEKEEAAQKGSSGSSNNGKSGQHKKGRYQKPTGKPLR
ncbi:retinol dehydrogenase [Diplogelasinospora grovesii]|uniref:Retinol dehydrogenase n=1 Tax=Diplogelasinospora grovesii TaxID=303347 RepID=A0AAN6S7Z7_9PEZI|nr:retinol dehydrogenase [Diplogelasinospora grovesii]